MAGEDADKSDPELTDAERIALSSLIHYDLMVREKEGNRITHASLGRAARLEKLVNAAEPGSMDQKMGAIVGNVLSKASRKGAPELKRYYAKLVLGKDKSFDNPPPYIKIAIAMLYGKPRVPLAEVRPYLEGDAVTQPDKRTPPPENEENEYALRDVFAKVWNKDPYSRERLEQNYSGLWDVIRYSAHTLVRPGEKVDDDPWVVRAAVQIGPVDLAQGRKQPWFEILYRPKGKPYRRSTGSAILINQGYFALVGREHDADAPIYVVAEALRMKQEYFRGLVVRRHSTGRFFTSRCVFVRSKAKTMEELASKIDVYRESELRQKFSGEIAELDRCLEEAVNTIPNEGRSVLLL